MQSASSWFHCFSKVEACCYSFDWTRSDENGQQQFYKICFIYSCRTKWLNSGQCSFNSAQHHTSPSLKNQHSFFVHFLYHQNLFFLKLNGRAVSVNFHWYPCLMTSNQKQISHHRESWCGQKMRTYDACNEWMKMNKRRNTTFDQNIKNRNHRICQQ